jgi:hypothetical protein
VNAIQQISMKLQLGLDPASNIHPDQLRALWNQVGKAREARGRASRSRRGFDNGPMCNGGSRH